MPVYNKLVRDLIPQIIENTGKGFRTRILSDDEYVVELKTKLKEESEEFYAASTPKDSLEELADMLEVIRSLAAVHGSNWDELEALRAKKAEARGGFEERVYLIDVD